MKVDGFKVLWIFSLILLGMSVVVLVVLWVQGNTGAAKIFGVIAGILYISSEVCYNLYYHSPRG